MSDQEVAAEIERLTADPQLAPLRPFFQSPQGLASVRRSLLTRKTIDRLVEIVYGTDRAQKGGEAP